MRYVVLLLLSGCSTTFFGASREGPYVKHFQEQLWCAYVKGWAPNPDEKVCMCIVKDPYFSLDKSFIRSPSNAFCESEQYE
jgi:hypothetical protein